MDRRRCGTSSLEVSALTLGLMVRDCRPGEPFVQVRQTVLAAFDHGINTIDLAAGYGGGAVERAVGAILKSDLAAHRDQLVLATKGAWADGSRAGLMETIDRSLQQLGVDHVDLFYHHAYDAATPLEETAAALHDLVRTGKTRFVGISNYHPDHAAQIATLLRERGTPCVAHQGNYNLLNRWVEDTLLDVLPRHGMSLAVFSVLNQGLLSDGSVAGPRPGSRAEKSLQALVDGVATGEPAYGRYPSGVDVRRHLLAMLVDLREIARARGQSLSQLALAWVLRQPAVATVVVGMSSVEQVDANVAALDHLEFSTAELERIAAILPPR